MLDKSVLEIGDEIHHRHLNKSAVFDETCYVLESLNPDPTSIFIQFKDEFEPKKVSIELCELLKYDLDKICKVCLNKMREKNQDMCDECIQRIQIKLGG